MTSGRVLAISPAPDPAADARLAEMLGVHPTRLHAYVATANLLEYRAPADAGDCASPGVCLLDDAEHVALLACGERVVAAIGCVHHALVGYFSWHDCLLEDRTVRRVASFPHPTAGTGFWAVPEYRRRAAAFLRASVYGRTWVGLGLPPNRQPVRHG